MVSHAAQIGNQIRIRVVSVCEARTSQKGIRCQCRWSCITAACTGCVSHATAAITAIAWIRTVLICAIEFRFTVFPQMLHVHNFLQWKREISCVSTFTLKWIDVLFRLPAAKWVYFVDYFVHSLLRCPLDSVVSIDCSKWARCHRLVTGWALAMCTNIGMLNVRHVSDPLL